MSIHRLDKYSSYRIATTQQGTLEISVDDKAGVGTGESGYKYTFQKWDPTRHYPQMMGRPYGVTILRHGETWVQHPDGENAIACLLWAFEALHNENTKLRAQIDEMTKEPA